jgi:hypothetical protein
LANCMIAELTVNCLLSADRAIHGWRLPAIGG